MPLDKVRDEDRRATQDCPGTAAKTMQGPKTKSKRETRSDLHHAPSNTSSATTRRAALPSNTSRPDSGSSASWTRNPSSKKSEPKSNGYPNSCRSDTPTGPTASDTTGHIPTALLRRRHTRLVSHRRKRRHPVRPIHRRHRRHAPRRSHAHARSRLRRIPTRQTQRLHRRTRRLRHLVHLVHDPPNPRSLGRRRRPHVQPLPGRPATASPRHHPHLGLLHHRQVRTPQRRRPMAQSHDLRLHRRP